ncbi:MAG TPA: FHA domain-containing protein [Verrucomicrobiae bacterium]|nr:FHA domain-containing protein [Verrucomicrobiae bacterium]
MARLVVNPDSAEAWEIELGPGTIILGRSPENDFQIDHSSISSSHCQVVVSGGNVTLKDLGSTSGTFLEGQLVEEARLRSGQVFCLGEVRLRFEDESGTGPVPVPVVRLSGGRPPGRAWTAPPAQPERSFMARVGGAFLYPLKKDGALVLLTGTIFLSMIKAGAFFARFGAVKGIGLGSAICMAFLLLMTGFGAGYLTSYLRRVVTGTAMGEQMAPDWPDLSDFAADILAPLFQLAATMLVSLVPAIVVAMGVQGAGRWGPAAILVACGAGVIYFPMAFLAAAMFDSVAALNPLLVVPSIAKIPGQYLLTVAVFGAVLAAKWLGDDFLPQAISVPVVPSVISTFVGLYLLMVEARVLGLLYRVNKEELGWFGRR